MRVMPETIGNITKPRRKSGNCQHSLENILAIAFCAVICGAREYWQMEEFGIQRKDRLAKHLNLENGIPDGDTFMRLFRRLNPAEVAGCLHGWFGKRGCAGKNVAVDGKTARGRADGANAQTSDLALPAYQNPFKH